MSAFDTEKVLPHCPIISALSSDTLLVHSTEATVPQKLHKIRYNKNMMPRGHITQVAFSKPAHILLLMEYYT